MKAEILQCLSPCHPWAGRLLWFDSIGSTNTTAKGLASQGAPHGTTLIADHQTGGRGRRGRDFHSPAGSGIYLSVILRPECAPTELMHLTCAAGVAMCDAVEAVLGLRPGIKWTNDLVWGNRKLGGILTELGLDSQGRVDYAVVGIGINCTQGPEDFPPEIGSIATSLSAISGKCIHRAQMAAAMMDALGRMDADLLSGQEKLITQYRKDCITLGREISMLGADGSVRHGKALDIDGQGALVVEFPEGIIPVNSGEVSIRGMYGYL